MDNIPSELQCGHIIMIGEKYLTYARLLLIHSTGKGMTCSCSGNQPIEQ